MAASKEPVTITGPDGSKVSADALIESTESLSSEVPTYSVEDGFSVSDSVIINPMVLSMTLFFSDTPVTHRLKHGAKIGRAQEAVAALKKIYFSKGLVTINTRRGVLRSMAITSMELTNAKETGTSREIPISFQQVRVTEAKTVGIPDSYGKGGATGASAGTANTKISDTPPPTTQGSGEEGGSKQSLLHAMGGAIKHGLAGSAGLYS